MGSVTELAHTADVGFEVRADSLRDLFSLAAEGLASARGAAADRESPDEVGELELERPDLERLLVAWLRELLYRSMRDDVVPSAEVEEVHPPARDGPGQRPDDGPGRRPDDDGRGQGPADAGGQAPDDGRGQGPADAGGQALDGDPDDAPGARLRARVRWLAAAGPPVREIKGVTYHGLEVRREDGGWHARVVLDV